MQTTEPAIDPQEQADQEAVLRHFLDGTPLDPGVALRVQQRAEKITVEIRSVHGIIDDETFYAILDDDE